MSVVSGSAGRRLMLELGLRLNNRYILADRFEMHLSGLEFSSQLIGFQLEPLMLFGCPSVFRVLIVHLKGSVINPLENLSSSCGVPHVGSCRTRSRRELALQT